MLHLICDSILHTFTANVAIRCVSRISTLSTMFTLLVRIETPPALGAVSVSIRTCRSFHWMNNSDKVDILYIHKGAKQKKYGMWSGEPGLVDRVLALHAGSRGFDSHRGHMSERFFRSNRSGYPHPLSYELENSGTRVAVGDCSVTERRR